MQIQNSFSEQMKLEGALAGSLGKTPPPPPPPAEKPAEEDALASFMRSSGQDEEVKNFMQEVMEMEASGEFDAESLAESAPDSLKAYADENDIDLTSFFQQKHDQFVARSNASSTSTEETSIEQYQSIANKDSADSQLMSALKTRIGVDTLA